VIQKKTKTKQNKKQNKTKKKTRQLHYHASGHAGPHIKTIQSTNVISVPDVSWTDYVTVEKL